MSQSSTVSLCGTAPLFVVQDVLRSVEYYRKFAKAAGQEAPAPIATPACTDPGAFVPPPPLEASGAHSPATTATAPPSSKDAAAEQHGQLKK